MKIVMNFVFILNATDCFCGLAIRVPGYKSRGPGFSLGVESNGVHYY
jgi:hypothetical protein